MDAQLNITDWQRKVLTEWAKHGPSKAAAQLHISESAVKLNLYRAEKRTGKTWRELLVLLHPNPGPAPPQHSGNVA